MSERNHGGCSRWELEKYDYLDLEGTYEDRDPVSDFDDDFDAREQHEIGKRDFHSMKQRLATEGRGHKVERKSPPQRQIKKAEPEDPARIR